MGKKKNSKSEELNNIQCNEGCEESCNAGARHQCERVDLVAELKKIKKLMKEKWENDSEQSEKAETKSQSDQPDEVTQDSRDENEGICYCSSISEEVASEIKDPSNQIQNKFYTDKVFRDDSITCKYHSGKFMRKRLKKHAKTWTGDPAIDETEVCIDCERPYYAKITAKDSAKAASEVKGKSVKISDPPMNPKLYLSRRLRERIPEKLLDQVGKFDARKPEEVSSLRAGRQSLKSTCSVKKVKSNVSNCSRFNVFPLKNGTNYQPFLH